MTCRICESIRRREADRLTRSGRGTRLAKSGRYEHPWHHKRTEKYREFVKGRLEFFKVHPEELKRVRWNARWPDYVGGAPAPEYDGYVQGSFSSASRSVTEQPTLLDYLVVA